MSNVDSLVIVSLAKAEALFSILGDIWWLSAVYDYGPLGVELKRNIQNTWWKI